MSLKSMHEEKKKSEQFIEHELPQQRKEPYLQELPKAEPITLLQFQRLFYPYVEVFIKPNNHKIYWQGPALYIPKEMYSWEVRDISLRKSYEEEQYRYGSVSLFVEPNEFYDALSDLEELEMINEYHAPCHNREER